jgi:N-hydroxyarylamine O-acetyltransferase
MSNRPRWDVDSLDLGAYLDRIGDDGPRDPGVATLTRLHRAHVAAIPFENLDIMLGRAVSVDLTSVQAKLVGRRRGGYCYEHATLFGAVLQRLGYRVDRLLARTGDPLEHPRPRSHMVLRVETRDGPWLADVGFGSGLLAPLPLTEGGPHRQGAWEYELRRGPDTAWRLREHDGAGWTTIQTFTEEPQYPVDVEVANHNTATSPGSPFVRQPIVVRKDETSVRRLLGREYSVDRPGQPAVRRRCTDAEFAEALGELGPALPPEDIAALVATLPPDDAGRGTGR